MNAEAYSYFGHQIQILLPSLWQIQATGTDEVVALTTAFENTFLNAIHLCCFKHFQNNCETKLQDLNFSSKSYQEILADIFELDDSDQRRLSLVDATDASEFTVKLEALKNRWNKTEKKTESPPWRSHNASWFLKEKSEVMKNNMINTTLTRTFIRHCHN